MWPRGFVVLVFAGVGLVACSGSMGSNSAMPQTMSSPNFGVNPTPAPSPTAASNVLTYGDNANFQELPSVGGFGGAIAFPTAGPATPAPTKGGKSPSPAPAPTAVEIAIGATLYIHKPEDGPDLNLASGKGKHRKGREHPARALAYIELLPTHDATLTAYPRIAIDIPRDIATEYRDGEFGIALWNSGEKDNVYRLAVEALDTSATPPPTSAPVHTHEPEAKASGPATATPTPGAPLFTPTPTPQPTRMPNGQFPTAPPTQGGVAHGGVAASAAPTLPPQRILFAATQSTLKLVANRPAIFVVYALPEPAISPTPKPSGSPKATTEEHGGSPAPRVLESAPAPAPSGGGATPAAASGSSAPRTIQTTPAPGASP
jgi:hypothetical protein